MRKKVLFLVSILAVAGLFIGAYFIFIAPQPLGEGEKTVTLEIIAGDKSFNKQIKTNKEFVFDMLVEIKDEIGFTYTEGMYGAFIDGLLEVVPEYPEFFAFFINEEYSMVGISTAAMSDGDKLSFIAVVDGWSENTPEWVPDYREAESNLWIFVLIAGMVLSICLMAYVASSRSAIRIRREEPRPELPYRFQLQAR